MKKPMPSDFGLTEENIEEIQRQHQEYQHISEEETKAEVKKRSRGASALIWIAVAFLAVELIIIIVDGVNGRFRWRIFVTNYVIAMFFFVMPAIYARVSSKRKSTNTDMSAYVDQKLEGPYGKYLEAVKQYERNSQTVFKYLWDHLDRPRAVETLGYIYEGEGYDVLPSPGFDQDFATIYLKKKGVSVAVRYQDNPQAAHQLDVENFITAMARRGGIDSLKYVCPVDIQVSALDVGVFAQGKGMDIEIWNFDNIYSHALGSSVYNEDKETLERPDAKGSSAMTDSSSQNENSGDVSL